MSHVLTLTDEQFQALQREAAQRGQTLESLADSLVTEMIAQLEQPLHPIYENEDDWLRHLGMTDEEIQESKRLAALDHDADDDGSDDA